ncbi:hypothetical protein BST61_g8691 [Cercospora zeina]
MAYAKDQCKDSLLPADKVACTYHDNDDEFSDDQNDRKKTHSSRCAARHRSFWLCQGLALAVNLALFYVALNAPPPSLRRSFELQAVPLASENVRWDAALGQYSPYTAMDPAIADKAWADIAVSPSQGYVKLSKTQMQRLGKYSPSSVRAKDGSGYLALVAVFHQLHCLDYLRKTSSMYAHLYPDTFENATVPVKLHIPHCINLLRMALMCSSELTVSTHNWVDGWIEPWEDWQSQHQCRNFDRIKDWARENKAEVVESYVHPELGLVLHSKLNKSALPVGREVVYLDGLNLE